MSIFTALLGFFASMINLFKGEYERLDPVVKADIDSAIKAANIIKLNAEKDAPTVLALIENELGTFATDKITSVLNDVERNMGISYSFISNLQSLDNILEHLRTKQGPAWEDAIFNVAKYIATNLSEGSLTRNVAQIVIQFVYDHIFKPANLVIPIPTPAAPAPVVEEPILVEDTAAPEESAAPTEQIQTAQTGSIEGVHIPAPTNQPETGSLNTPHIPA